MRDAVDICNSGQTVKLLVKNGAKIGLPQPYHVGENWTEKGMLRVRGVMHIEGCKKDKDVNLVCGGDADFLYGHNKSGLDLSHGMKPATAEQSDVAASVAPKIHSMWFLSDDSTGSIKGLDCVWEAVAVGLKDDMHAATLSKEEQERDVQESMAMVDRLIEELENGQDEDEVCMYVCIYVCVSVCVCVCAGVHGYG